MCSYIANLNNLVDLRQLHDGEPWDALWLDWREDWRHLKLDLHIEPPSWVLGDMVLANDHTGIVFPSLANQEGTNVVIFTDHFIGDNSIKVLDPDRKLPHDQSSWAP